MIYILTLTLTMPCRRRLVRRSAARHIVAARRRQLLLALVGLCLGAGLALVVGG